MLDKVSPEITNILKELDKISRDRLDWPKFRKILQKYPKEGEGFFSKDELVATYRELDAKDFGSDLIYKIQLKPMRTQSGVTPVTVLTKPFPCPGQCIFCPSDVRMPKSYMSDEPGAQRAERNHFDPYLQTYRRIQALHQIGHNVEKVEIIILGGTWSFYPESYQIWFIKRIFEALNDFGKKIDQTEAIEEAILKPLIPNKYDKNYLSRLSTNITQEKFATRNKSQLEGVKSGNTQAQNAEAIASVSPTKYNTVIAKIYKEAGHKLIDQKETATWQELEKEHQINQTAHCRSVGLVIETRPDHISPKEVIRIRRLGCTKVQIGFQSLNDKVLDLNKRGHTTNQTRYAVKLLRQAGFKIHAHWMANLYGSSPENDIMDYKKMFEDLDFCPDELKIYPCSLIETAELVDYYKQQKWRPYNQSELLKVVTEAITNTPEYCRLTRVIRDIPGTDILVGNKTTNFREVAEKEIKDRGLEMKDIRAREIKRQAVTMSDLELKIVEYKVSTGTEMFLQFVTKRGLNIKANRIAAFLRLSLPKLAKHSYIEELDYSAIIRELHVYGTAVGIGKSEDGKAQHFGLGKQLLAKAEEIAQNKDYQNLAVISAIGTREYYSKRGYDLKEMYQLKALST